MSVLSRLRKAISGVDNPLARVILFGLSKNAVWTPADYTSLSKAGYENCMTVYACVNYIARAAAGIEWTATVGKKDAVDHPILRLLARPNEEEGRRAFIGKCFSYLLLTGNRYILAGSVGNQAPLSLWAPRPDRMKVLPGGPKGQLVGGYEYRVSSEPVVFDPGLVLHSKLFHPTDDWYGLSPLSVAAHAVDISNMASEWNARLLQNDMRPPGALSTEGKLDDNQYKRLKERMKSEWQGYENAGEPLLLEGGLKWVNFMLTAKEMDWLNTTKTTKRDICTVFNMDPCLIGDSEYATYSNKIEARKGAYEDVILPFMEELCDDLNAWLSPKFGAGVLLGIDKDKIPALQESREKQYTYLQGAWWLRLNELRKMTGQDPVPGPEGELILVPIGKIPLESAAVSDGGTSEPDPAGTDPDLDPEQDPDEAAPSGKPKKSAPALLTKGFWQVPERKRALWDNFVARIEAKERGLVALAKGFLQKQAQAVGAKARQAGSVQDLRTADLVDVKAEAERFKKVMRAWYIHAFSLAGAAGVRAGKGELPDLELKVDLFNLTPERLKALDEMIINSGTKIAESTMRMVVDILKSAEFDNMTVEEITQALIGKLEAFSQFRCRLIARTEAAKVENWGQVEGYRETEFVEKKGWMCTFVPDSRESHKEADGQEVALSDDFDLAGDRMAYPGDPRGDAGNVCNCLCTTYPVVGD